MSVDGLLTAAADEADRLAGTVPPDARLTSCSGRPRSPRGRPDSFQCRSARYSRRVRSGAGAGDLCGHSAGTLGSRHHHDRPPHARTARRVHAVKSSIHQLYRKLFCGRAGAPYPTERTLRLSKKSVHDAMSGCSLSRALHWRSVMPPQIPNSTLLSSASAPHSCTWQ
jgi:hypothetical protein